MCLCVNVTQFTGSGVVSDASGDLVLSHQPEGRAQRQGVSEEDKMDNLFTPARTVNFNLIGQDGNAFFLLGGVA